MASLRSLFFQRPIAATPTMIPSALDDHEVEMIVLAIVDKLHQTPIPDNPEITAAQHAMTDECIAMFRELYATNPSAINLQLHDGCTLLHYAVSRANHQLVKFLLNQGANFDIKNHAGYTPVHLSLLLKRAACFYELHEYAKLNLVVTQVEPSIGIEFEGHSYSYPIRYMNYDRYYLFIKRYLNYHYQCENDLSIIYLAWEHTKKEKDSSSPYNILGVIAHNIKMNSTDEEIKSIMKMIVSDHINWIEGATVHNDDLLAAIKNLTNDIDNENYICIYQGIRLMGPDVTLSYLTPKPCHFGNVLKPTLLGHAVMAANPLSVDLLLQHGAKMTMPIEMLSNPQWYEVVTKMVGPLELALMVAHAHHSPEMASRQRQIITLLLKNSAPRTRESVLNYLFSIKESDTNFNFIIAILLPYIHIAYGADNQSNWERLHENANRYLPILRRVNQHYYTFLRDLKRDSTSFLAKLPSDILENYLLRFINYLPPIDNEHLSDAARAAKKENDNSSNMRP